MEPVRVLQIFCLIFITAIYSVECASVTISQFDSVAYCDPYCDLYGYYQTGKWCVSSDSSVDVYCCGSQHDRYCCGDKNKDVDGLYPSVDKCPNSSWWFYQWRVLVGLIGTIIVMLMMAACCYYCCGGTGSGSSRLRPSRLWQGQSGSNDRETSRNETFDPLSPYAFTPPDYDSLPKDPPQYIDIFGGNGTIVGDDGTVVGGDSIIVSGEGTIVGTESQVQGVGVLNEGYEATEDNTHLDHAIINNNSTDSSDRVTDQVCHNANNNSSSSSNNSNHAASNNITNTADHFNISNENTENHMSNPGNCDIDTDSSISKITSTSSTNSTVKQILNENSEPNSSSANDSPMAENNDPNFNVKTDNTMTVDSEIRIKASSNNIPNNNLPNENGANQTTTDSQSNSADSETIHDDQGHNIGASGDDMTLSSACDTPVMQSNGILLQSSKDCIPETDFAKHVNSHSGEESMGVFTISNTITDRLSSSTSFNSPEDNAIVSERL